MSAPVHGNRLTLEDKLFTVRRKRLRQAHVTVDAKLCADCTGRICTSICPAGVYVWNQTENRLEVKHDNCLECGACRVACDMDSIQWSNPLWGEGIS